MKIKDITARALRLIGRVDIAEALEGGSDLTEEQSLQVNTLLYCFYAVEDELARGYFPVTCTETVNGVNGKFYYSDFTYQPVRVISVTSGSTEIKFEVFLHYLETQNQLTKATIEYEYTPTKQGIDGESAYDGVTVGESLLAYGALAEYCMISGEVEAAEMWESRYRCEINRARAKIITFSAPERSWI